MILGNRVINPGEFRTQITIQTRTVTEQAGGFETPTWANSVNVWAKWTNAHGNESFQAALQAAEAPSTALVRYQAGVDPTCAILKSGERYEILSVDDIGDRHEFMELRVKKMRGG